MPRYASTPMTIAATPIRHEWRRTAIAIRPTSLGLTPTRPAARGSPSRRRAMTTPCRNARHPIIRTADVHAAGHEVNLTVAVEIPERQGYQVRRRGRDGVQRKL